MLHKNTKKLETELNNLKCENALIKSKQVIENTENELLREKCSKFRSEIDELNEQNKNVTEEDKKVLQITIANDLYTAEKIGPEEVGSEKNEDEETDEETDEEEEELCVDEHELRQKKKVDNFVVMINSIHTFRMLVLIAVFLYTCVYILDHIDIIEHLDYENYNTPYELY